MNTPLSILSLVPSFLRALASVLPTLATRLPSGSTFATVAEEVLAAGAALIERGEEGASDLTVLTHHIEAMGQGNPSQEQWDALKAASDAAHAAIQKPQNSST